MDGLKVARKRKGMTQTEVAQAVGITQSAYSHYEQGIRSPKMKTLVNLSKVLETSIDEITKGVTDDERRI